MPDLIAEATKARDKHRALYSGFGVGAAVKCTDGSIYHGANIEAAASSVSLCAERVAVAAAIMAGKIPVELAVIAETAEPVTPCGHCRQFLVDFTPLKIVMANTAGETRTMTARQLMPLPYHRRDKRKKA